MSRQLRMEDRCKCAGIHLERNAAKGLPEVASSVSATSTADAPASAPPPPTVDDEDPASFLATSDESSNEVPKVGPGAREDDVVPDTSVESLVNIDDEDEIKEVAAAEAAEAAEEVEGGINSEMYEAKVEPVVWDELEEGS